MRFVGVPRTLAVAGILAASCGCGSTTTSPTGTLAVIAVSVAPNPINSTVYSTIGPIYAVNWTTSIVESGGRGGVVQYVLASLYDPATGALLAVANYDSSDLLVFIGRSRIQALGSMSVPQQTTFSSTVGKAAILTVTVSFKDDGGVVTERSVLVKVQ